MRGIVCSNVDPLKLPSAVFNDLIFSLLSSKLVKGSSKFKTQRDSCDTSPGLHTGQEGTQKFFSCSINFILFD